jgi:hypothetical protein
VQEYKQGLTMWHYFLDIGAIVLSIYAGKKYGGWKFRQGYDKSKRTELQKKNKTLPLFQLSK